MVKSSDSKTTLISPDTSVIIEGILSKLIEERKIKNPKILISQIVIDELESQANRGREIGFDGLREITKLRSIKDVEIIVEGGRPTPDEIRLAKKGRLDALIRDTAKKKNAVLYTQDIVQAEAAKAEGIEVVYNKPNEVITDPLERYFTKDTMSVHLKEDTLPMAKKGTPGDIKLVTIGKKKTTKEDMEKISDDIENLARHRKDANIEISRRGSQVFQIGNYRIALNKPPFSIGIEITAVRPIVKFNLEDYSPSEKLMERLKTKAEGLLVTGPPGSGKSTFVQGLAEFYWKEGKIIKTMESPRDLSLPVEITQYAPLEGNMANTADILLLVRPDYTIYDEVRGTKDFQIFSDMRLAGVGMVGVIHATDPINSIQRFISRTELGMVPHIIDTIIFIKGGKIEKVFSINMIVRVPTGMTESDLARPIVEVKDFHTKHLEYEIYTYGEENMVIPITDQETKASGVDNLAREVIYQEFMRFDSNCDVDIQGSDRAIVHVRNDVIGKIIGKEGRNIEKIENRLGIKIDIQPKTNTTGKEVDFELGESGAYIIFFFSTALRGRNANIYINDEYVFTATVGKGGQIKLAKVSDAGQDILSAMATHQDIKSFITV